MFLQTWRAKLSGTSNSCPRELKFMVPTALKHGTRLEALKLTQEALRDMPIWFHARENARLRKAATSSASSCLRKKHGVKTVGNAETTANYLDNPEHKKSKRCKCQGCKKMRDDYKCTHPDECFRRARCSRKNRTLEESIPDFNVMPSLDSHLVSGAEACVSDERTRRNCRLTMTFCTRCIAFDNVQRGNPRPG